MRRTLLIEHSDVYSKESARVQDKHGSFRSRYNEGPLRLFTRQRALTLTPHLVTIRQPSLPPPSARAPLQPLPHRQPYPWSFSHTTPPLAINAREKVGARARALCVPSPPSNPIFPSHSLTLPLFLASLFFPTDRAPFLSLSRCCTDSRGWR